MSIFDGNAANLRSIRNIIIFIIIKLGAKNMVNEIQVIEQYIFGKTYFSCTFIHICENKYI